MKLPEKMSIRSYRHQIPIIFNMDPASDGFNKPLTEEQLYELLRHNKVYKADKIYYDDEVLDKLYKRAIYTGSLKDLKAYLKARKERL